ncbi:MAG TPA: iron-containing alcohol dehydrogenase [Dehalococcoidia bacterium]|nr:iron-containing alcohol dehydrogenase [Dehalococcoidia bacterium]
MPYRRFVVPRTIAYGPGALEHLSSVPAQRAMIVTDPGVRDLGLAEKVEKTLQAGNIATTVFDKVEPDPSKETAWAAFAVAQEFKPDMIVGLGGGSPIDTGKAAWVLYENPDLAEKTFLEFLMEVRRRELRKKAKYVAIATTSGTGSEVTSAAVITDRDVDPPNKAGFGSAQLVPDIAIADPELAASMPPAVTANTGYDALVHAVECYVLTPPSDMVDPLAIWSARTILEWLPKAVANGADMTARDKMHLASLQAGIAFSNGRLGMVHGTAHLIGGTHHIAHGRANAFMLCQVFTFLYQGYRARLAALASHLGVEGKDDQTKVMNLLALFDDLKQKIGIPLAIKDSGLEESEWQAHLGSIAASYAATFSRIPGLNELSPEDRRARGIPASVEEVEAIFMHAWNGTREELA